MKLDDVKEKHNKYFRRPTWTAAAYAVFSPGETNLSDGWMYHGRISDHSSPLSEMNRNADDWFECDIDGNEIKQRYEKHDKTRVFYKALYLINKELEDKYE